MNRRQFLQAGLGAGIVGAAGCASKRLSSVAGESSAAEGQHAQIGVTNSTPNDSWFTRTTHPQAQWFPKARLGMFIHWGISSVHGDIDISWGMIRDTHWDRDGTRVTPNQYFALADRFHPDKYDPHKWLAAAKAMGCEYAVFTTRHHDGYSMWPSKYGDFGTRTHLDGRDLVRPYVEACRAAGLKVGLYFSPPDWYYSRRHMSFRYSRAPGAPLGLDHEPTTLAQITPEHVAEQQRQVRGQIEELLTNYGRIDLMWFDGTIPGAREIIPVEWVRELQPQIVVNPRLWGVGDYETPECKVPTSRPAGWWEMCHIWQNAGWGYCAREEYKTTTWMLNLLAKAATWEGNLLINVSPRPDGSLPDGLYNQTNDVSNWMKKHGPAVFDANAGPYPEQCDLPVTTTRNKWYIFVPPEHAGPVILKNVHNAPRTTLMGSGQAVATSFANDTATLNLAGSHRDRLMDVVVAEWA